MTFQTFISIIILISPNMICISKNFLASLSTKLDASKWKHVVECLLEILYHQNIENASLSCTLGVLGDFSDDNKGRKLCFGYKLCKHIRSFSNSFFL